MGNEQSRPLAKDHASGSAEPSSLKRQRSTSEDTPVRSTRQRRGTPSRYSIISVSSGSPVNANRVSPRRRANQPTVESDDEDSPERPAQDVALVPLGDLLSTATPTRARSFASQSDVNVPPTSPGYAPTSPLYQGNLSPGNPPTLPYRGAPVSCVLTSYTSVPSQKLGELARIRTNFAPRSRCQARLSRVLADFTWISGRGYANLS
jgi:hypothetical protein